MMKYPYTSMISNITVRQNYKVFGLFVLALSPLSLGTALAQDTGGVATAPSPSTVVKNLSPIDLTVLDIKLPRAKEFTLPNGVRVFVIEDHRTPLVNISVSLRAGELFEPAGKSAVAALTAAMLDEGTTTRSTDAIADTIDRYGANLNATTGLEKTTVSISGLVDNADTLVELLADVIRNPTFPEDRFNKVRFRMAASASSRATDPIRLASDALSGALYGANTPYGRPSSTAEQINAVQIADLKSFHDTLYRPEGAIIGVAGDVDANKIVNILKNRLGDWKAPSSVGPVPTIPKATLASLPAAGTEPVPIIIDRPGSAQTVLLFGIPAISRADPDYIPLFVANRVLGGGFNSRLNQKLREEKGYTYGARSTLSAPKWQGTWEASASVRNAVTIPAAQEFVNEFARLQSVAPKPGELDLVKQSIIGSFALTLESPEAILGRSIERYEYGLPADYWDTYAAKIRAVTPEDITRVARKYWGRGATDPSKPTTWLVAVGEKSAIESGLNDLMH